MLLSLEEGTLVLRFYTLVQVNYLAYLSLKQMCWVGDKERGDARRTECWEEILSAYLAVLPRALFPEAPGAFLKCVPNSLSIHSVSRSKDRFLGFARHKLEDKSFHTLQLMRSKPALCPQYRLGYSIAYIA